MNLLFDQEHFERLLPDYLSKAEKGRLLSALAQFHGCLTILVETGEYV